MEKLTYLKSNEVDVEGQKLFIASDETLDRHGEIISINAWDLTNFKANPVILGFHNYDEPPLGYAEKLGFKNIDGSKRLVLDPVFHGKTELSRLYKELKDEGYPIALSVGFIPKEMNDNVITKAELLEVSVVSVPANPSAMSLAYSKGFDKATVKQAMGENFDQAEKELEIENLKKEITELKDTVTSLSETTKQTLDLGRKPTQSKKEISRRVAIKVMYKAMELLAKSIKE